LGTFLESRNFTVPEFVEFIQRVINEEIEQPKPSYGSLNVTIGAGLAMYDYKMGLCKSIASKAKPTTLKDGVKALQLFIGADQKVEKVTVDMGEPILDAALIPVTSDKNRVINEPLAFNSEIQYNITTVLMGNPHAVIFTTDILQLDLPKIGPVIENATIFPRRTNTEFIEVLTKNHVKMRVWERGSGETMACGTGACASVVAGVLNGLISRRTTVELLGGELTIEWKEEDNHVYLTGGATTVFEGEI
jgi:diaminopimelate epimerase